MKRQISILVLLFFSFHGYSENLIRQEASDIYLIVPECAVNLDYKQTNDKLSETCAFIKKLQADGSTIIQLIEVNSYTSPVIVGDVTLRNILKDKREKIRRYIISETGIDNSLIYVSQKEIIWQELRDMVESSNMPYRKEVLDRLTEEGDRKWCRENPDECWFPQEIARTLQLKEIGNGVAYRYMERNMFEQLDRTTVIVWYTENGEKCSKDFIISDVAPQKIAEVQLVEEAVDEEVEEVKPVDEEPVEEEVKPVDEEPKPISEKERNPLFALKTNMLYDVLTVLNVSAEVPIGKRISLAGEWIFPWWTIDNGREDSKRHRLQLLTANLEARYWFGDREDKPQLTGWFAGIYGGGGKYDFEYDADGVQGEFYTAGLSAGYAHTINKKETLRLEYSLSAGYMQTDYRDYNAIFGAGVDSNWHPIRRSTGNYLYFGPTAAKVSLVWMLFNNKKNRKE
ncbi:MAG: DUF3575 domain-containing protein [Rikenellaceae bacterium]